MKAPLKCAKQPPSQRLSPPRKTTFPTKPCQTNNQYRNPFPSQKDGVLADGTVINSTPNVDTLNNSCWTSPNKPLYSLSDPEFENDMCQICFIQSGLGPNAWYEAWVRDANNRATGSLSAIELGPGTAAGKMYTFSAALKDLTIGVTPNASPSEASAVTMMWGDAVETPQMYFNAATKMGGTNCTFSNDAHEGTMTYFQCTFGCGLPFQRMA